MVLARGHVPSAGRIAGIREWVRLIATRSTLDTKVRALLGEVVQKVDELVLCIQALREIRDAAQYLMIVQPSSKDPRVQEAIVRLKGVLEMYAEQRPEREPARVSA